MYTGAHKKSNSISQESNPYTATVSKAKTTSLLSFAPLGYAPEGNSAPYVYCFILC